MKTGGQSLRKYEVRSQQGCKCEIRNMKKDVYPEDFGKAHEKLVEKVKQK